MFNLEELGEFWRGRVVAERDQYWDPNPGHVVGFVRERDRILIRVEFANGDRFNFEPHELIRL